MSPKPPSAPSPRVIPIAPAALPAARRLQWRRRLFQGGFYLLFILAPVFDLFRFDLDADHAWLLGFEWRLGLDDFLAKRASNVEAGTNLLLRLFLPVFGLAAVVLWISWKWGRLFCGWLCPHFSIVEGLNALFVRASGKPTLWEKAPLPAVRADGSRLRRDPHWWLLVVPVGVGLAFSWAVVLLTYVLPPAEIYANLAGLSFTRNQTVFLAIVTAALSVDFLFARHLFCRYMCSVGVFQSLIWMKNRDALVVGFDRARAGACSTCLPERESACNAVCPMRLKPRSIKRHMFTCTQCALCLEACAESQQHNPDGPLLSWVSGEAARRNEAGFSAVREREG